MSDDYIPDYSVCAELFCNAVAPTSTWKDGGWFLQKNGDKWCPNHIPDWLQYWRERTRRARE